MKMRTSFGGLNAVLIIQYAGKPITSVKSTPTVLAMTVPIRPLRRPPSSSAGARRRLEGRRSSMLVAISPHLRS